MRNNYEEKFKEISNSHASTLAQSTTHLSSEVEELRANIESLEEELVSTQTQSVNSKAKREALIRELKLQNGQMTEQFIQANSSLARAREEADRLRDEIKRKESALAATDKNERIERNRREDLEKELRELRDKSNQPSSFEEELMELRNIKLPEKESVVLF